MNVLALKLRTNDTHFSAEAVETAIEFVKQQTAAVGSDLPGHTQFIRGKGQTLPEYCAPEERFLRELEDFIRTEDAENVLATAIDWGRFPELFEYDSNSGVLTLDALTET